MANYLSVSEYAALTGKDGGNIRRLISSGRLPAIKVGNQWCIEEGTPYPEDRRRRSGEYVGWREKHSVKN